jgi:2'-5' RNA ligase
LVFARQRRRAAPRHTDSLPESARTRNGSEHLVIAPFGRALPADHLLAHIRAAVRGVAPFPVELRGITGAEGAYLCPGVQRGNDALVDLHDQLYSGPLAAYRSREHTFVPHLTVGRIGSPAAFRAALDATRAFDKRIACGVGELSIGRIAPDTSGPSRTTEHGIAL